MGPRDCFSATAPDDPAQKRFRFRDGRVYFSRRTERQIYFGFTIVLVVLGLLARFGWLG